MGELKVRRARAANPRAGGACWAEIREARAYRACHYGRRPGCLTCRWHAALEADARALEAALPKRRVETCRGTS